MTRRDFTIAVFIGVVVAIMLGVALREGYAHQAPEGWAYDPECCHVMDCAPVPEGAIREVAGGYAVRLLPGQHMMVRQAPVEAFIAHGDSRIRVSGDAERHACVSASGTIYCIYLQPGGV